MPSYRCRHPGCKSILKTRSWCSAHAADAVAAAAAAEARKSTIQKRYDEKRRDAASKKFYDSAAWKRCRKAKLAATPTCERCQRVFAEHVHHKKPVRDCTPKEKLDHANLLSLCPPCHNAIEGAIAHKAPADDAIAGILDVIETDQFIYDPEAAERPIRFIEKFCRHYEGRFAGMPFLLDDVQKTIVRNLYGWKERATGYRRFRQMWFEAAAGAGKSPLLAALGLFGLMADGEQGAQVYSVASNYSQARVVFDCAKRFIEESPELAKRLKVHQYEISHPQSKSFWRIISGKGPKAGLRPSLVLADELHEWSTREVYDSLQGRMTKRTQPLWISCTNAGESRQTMCWALHEEAADVLRGKSKNDRLYPVIFAAPPEADPASEQSWKLANPLLGITISPEKVRDEWLRAEGSPALEARFRRLYLSQWVQGHNKWLDLNRWDACCQPLVAEMLKDLPLYIGIDLSQGDDLCAAIPVWVSPERFYIDARFWLPRETADYYQVKEAIPYRDWAADGHIKLLDETTISPAVRARIAAELIELGKSGKLQAVCYDRYKADEVIAILEAAGITCLPIAQGYTVSPGCQELDRRLKEQSATIQPNRVLRANAEIVEVKQDERGNIWPVKPNAKGKYAGKRSAKIDGISALVTVLSEARKHAFPAAKKEWRGNVWVI